MSDDDRWIIVPNWEKFQTYGLGYRPRWIRNYTELLHKDEYVDLTFAARGLLHGIWLAYADHKGQLRVRDLAASTHAQPPTNLLRKLLESLSGAGLIEFSSTKPLTLTLGVKTEVPARARKADGKTELLRRALDLAADWNGGPSETFDDQIDDLERELHAQLTNSERSQLWEEALKREGRP